MVSRSLSKEFGRMSGMFSDYSNNVVVVLCIWLHQYSVAHTLNCGHNDKVEQHFNISCHLTILLVCTLTVCIEWCWTYLTKQRSSTQHSFLAYKYHLFWYLHTQYFFPQPWKKTVSFYRQPLFWTDFWRKFRLLHIVELHYFSHDGTCHHFFEYLLQHVLNCISISGGLM